MLLTITKNKTLFLNNASSFKNKTLFLNNASSFKNKTLFLNNASSFKNKTLFLNNAYAPRRLCAFWRCDALLAGNLPVCASPLINPTSAISAARSARPVCRPN